jgi:hypothetical protein
MFRSLFNREPDSLEKSITQIFARMEMVDIDSEEYDKLLEKLERLEQLKSKKTSGPSPDTLILAATNIAGILIIVLYEQKHVFTSKALSFILKPKI